MANENLAEQLTKLKAACAKWEKELAVYSKWAIENDGVLSATEKTEIERRKTEINAIKARIAQIEKAKGINQGTEEKGFFGKLIDGVKDIFDGNKKETPVTTETLGKDATTKDGTKTVTPKPTNKLGITPEEVKTKLANYFAAFDKLTVVVAGTTVEVETPYFMNDGNVEGPWDGNTMTAGKGSPKEVQAWLQDQINKGKITSKDPAKLRQYMKDHKIGVDCSGFVSQALNHVADKDGDMDFEKGEDPFTPDATGSGTFTGNKFTKIEPANVQIGDTLYFKNPTGGVNHIRIVGDVRHENGVVYYTIYESAGSTGPRKMEWKFADAKLQEFAGGKWVVKTSDTFYRWKEMEMEVPTGGGAGTGQQQDQNQTTGQDQTQANTTLSASVGKGGTNKKADVILVQNLLIKKGASITADGDCGSKTILAIEKFQKEKMGMAAPDGRIDPGGKTWLALSAGASGGNTTTTPADISGLESTRTNVETLRAAAKAIIDSVDSNKNPISLQQAQIDAVKAYTAKALEWLAAYNAAAQPVKTAFDAKHAGYAADLKTSQEWASNNFLPKCVVASSTAAPVEEALSATSTIKQSVGAGGKNDPADVLRVKQLLNKFGNKLELNGTADAALTNAIKAFQTKYMGAPTPDGRIDAGGKTWNSLLGIGRIQGNLATMAQQYGVEPAVILSIQSVESGGNGFFPDGRTKILFEGHVFWSQLKKAGKDPQKLSVGNEGILYPEWDSSKYEGGVKEYDRLAKAIKIDEICALKSASWGEFQIMGFNHATVGYSDVKSFVEAMKVPNGASLKALMEFCKNNNLLRHVQGKTKDWAKFAAGYNGPGYAKNQYDTKLSAAYERYKNV